MSTFVSSPQQADDDFSLDADLAPPLPKPEEIQIEYVDTRPDAEKQYDVNTVDENSTRWNREDKKQYGKNVRDRLSKMDYRIHQAERERDEARRERDALTSHAQQLQGKLQEMEVRANKWGNVALESTRSNVDQQITSVKAEIARLYQEPHPDATKVVDATERLSTLTAQRQQVQQLQPQGTENGSGPGSPGAAPQNVPTGPPTHPNYEMDKQRWLAANGDWFGKDMDKTRKLLDIEQKLVTNGVIMGSRAYWDAVEKAKSIVMTNGNQGGPPRQGQSKTVVTGSSYGAAPSSNGPIAAGGRRVVQLSQDERRAAARLGVSEQDWALEKLKRQEKLNAQR